jgi:hypothetical protein
LSAISGHDANANEPVRPLRRLLRYLLLLDAR